MSRKPKEVKLQELAKILIEHGKQVYDSSGSFRGGSREDLLAKSVGEAMVTGGTVIASLFDEGSCECCINKRKMLLEIAASICGPWRVERGGGPVCGHERNR